MERKQFVCDKCGCQHYTSDQFQATGGNFAKIFDVQNKKFTTISCKQCGYTEHSRLPNGWKLNKKRRRPFFCLHFIILDLDTHRQFFHISNN